MRSIPIARNKNISVMGWQKLVSIFEPISDYFLTDTLIIDEKNSIEELQQETGFIGITGKTCDWDIARELVCMSQIPIILAGGLRPENVYDGILHVQPAGVDSCTGTNASDEAGKPIRFKKDMNKVRRFVQETKRAEKQFLSIK